MRIDGSFAVTMRRSGQTILSGLLMVAVAGTSMPALAQSSGDEARLRKLESEVRALQRKVFPGGDGRYFEPEITAPTSGGSSVSTPSTTAVTDILVRLDAMEAQIASLTAQTEENSNALIQLTSRIVALENGGGVAATGSTTTSSGVATGGGASPATTTPAVSTPVTTAASGPSPERLAAVSQIAKPQTDDPADDEYSYGYRLWNAGFYPEAQQQLTLFVEKHPDHWRTTYGRNLLGRAYLDDGKPGDAAPWFLRNYQAGKNDARAPDSLLYLAEAMIEMDDSSRACIALAEFGETYPALAAGRLSDQYQRNLGRVTCN
jgi:TolA-binding protein